jgi:hypothetical protein
MGESTFTAEHAFTLAFLGALLGAVIGFRAGFEVGLADGWWDCAAELGVVG